ncbi:hypothetical protein BaRGS_00000828, partial [Batillaria attramentaria]
MFWGMIFLAGLFEAALCQQRPEPCCFPHQMQAKLTDAATLSGPSITVMDMAMDFDRGLEGTAVYQLDPQTGQRTETARTVINNGKHTSFTILPNGQCIPQQLTQHFPGPRERCFPATAEYAGSSNLGDPHSLPYEMWRMDAPNMTVTMYISSQGCVPLLEGFKGIWPPITTPFEQTTIWTDFTPEVRDHTLFYIPSDCVTSSMHSVFTIVPNGTCWRIPYEVHFPSARDRCLPASAQYISGGNMGSLQALPWDGWRVNLGNITVTMAFAEQGCVPVLEGLKITGGP